jgi:hypothetical protein
MQRDRLPYLLIPLAAFLAILPLILHGCSCGHDFDFHILSWMEAAHQFTHGNLHPHWAYTPAYNAGEPRFVFYPPLSWTIGALLGLLLPWTWTPIVYTWLALTASGLALHRLARSLATPTAATIAAVLYTVNPYMLFTAYERTAYAELLAAAWIPLLLHAILRPRITIPRIAIPIALLWLTNAPAAVMSSYALALLTVIRIGFTLRTKNPSTNPGTASSTRTNPGAPYLDSEIWASRTSATVPTHSPTTTQSPLQIARNTITGTLLGMALSAFYILPAAYERRYVQIAMATVTGMRIQDNFLFHHTGDIPHDQVLHTASVIVLIFIIATIIALAASKHTIRPNEKSSSPPKPNEDPSRSNEKSSSRPKRSEVERSPHSSESTPTPTITALTILTAAITLLLTPLTAFVWNHAPELVFLQFPWRLLAILAAVLATSIAIALSRLTLNPRTTTAALLIASAALIYAAYTTFHQPCDPEDTVAARLTLFHSTQGSDPTDEYTPTTADNDSLTHNDPAFWLSTNPNAKAPTLTQPAPAPTHLTINTPIPEDLILDLRDYPSWHITRNGSPITTRDQRHDGLIALPIPAGTSTISITYAHTLDQTIGDAISIAALLLLLITPKKKYPMPVEP